MGSTIAMSRPGLDGSPTVSSRFGAQLSYVIARSSFLVAFVGKRIRSNSTMAAFEGRIGHLRG